MDKASDGTEDTTPSHEQQIRRIVAAIRADEKRLRAKYPILQHQDALGAAILCFSLLGMIASGYLYYLGLLPAYLSILLSALFASLSHELEHDLIHRLYFKHKPAVQNVMMLVVWMMRPNTINPWYRRDIHLLHHKVSGTPQDLEERLVGNGVRHPLTRLLVMADSFVGILIRTRVLNAENRRFSLLEILNASFPFATLYYITWYLFLGYHAFLLGCSLTGTGVILPGWFLQGMDIVNLVVVVLIAPNFLRAFCLNVVTSYMHYYGGVTSLVQQTQVLTPWFLWPMQLFCWNFGSTHTIHHFVVNQPFYLRQMVARAGHQALKENGVRFNDLSTFSSGNAYRPAQS